MALAVLRSMPTFSYSVPTRQRSRGFPALWKNASSSSFFSMTDMAPNILLVGWIDDALLRNNRRNQFVRGHVERRVEDPDPPGRERPAENVRYFSRISLFDRNLLTRRTV